MRRSIPVSAAPALLVALLMVDSLHFVFARVLLHKIDPFISAMYVIGIATVEVGVYGVATRQLSLEPLRRYWGMFLGIGFCVAVSTVLNYSAVRYIDPGTASMLGKMSILFGLGFGILWLGDRLTRWQVVGAIVALAGMFTITFQPGDYLRLGSLMVVLSTFLYALHAALSKRWGGEMDLLNFFFYRLLLTTTFLLVIAVGAGALAPPPAGAWPWLLLVGTVDVVISRSLYYATLRRLDMSVFSIVLTLSPVAAILWSLVLFHTAPNGQQLLGGVGVLAGVFLVTAGPTLQNLRGKAWPKRSSAT